MDKPEPYKGKDNDLTNKTLFDFLEFVLDTGVINAKDRSGFCRKTSIKSAVEWLKEKYRQIDNLVPAHWDKELKQLWFEFEENKFSCDQKGKNIFKRALVDIAFEDVMKK